MLGHLLGSRSHLCPGFGFEIAENETVLSVRVHTAQHQWIPSSGHDGISLLRGHHHLHEGNRCLEGQITVLVYDIECFGILLTAKIEHRSVQIGALPESEGNLLPAACSPKNYLEHWSSRLILHDSFCRIRDKLEQFHPDISTANPVFFIKMVVAKRGEQDRFVYLVLFTVHESLNTDV